MFRKGFIRFTLSSPSSTSVSSLAASFNIATILIIGSLMVLLYYFSLIP